MKNPPNRMFIDPDKTQKGKFTFSMSFRVGWLTQNMLRNCCVRRIDVAAERPEGKWFCLSQGFVFVFGVAVGEEVFNRNGSLFALAPDGTGMTTITALMKHLKGNIMEKFRRAGEISGTKIIINLYCWGLRREFFSLAQFCTLSSRTLLSF